LDDCFPATNKSSNKLKQSLDAFYLCVTFWWYHKAYKYLWRHNWHLKCDNLRSETTLTKRKKHEVFPEYILDGTFWKHVMRLIFHNLLLYSFDRKQKNLFALRRDIKSGIIWELHFFAFFTFFLDAFFAYEH